MEWLCFILGVALIFVAAGAVIGHGLWVAAVWLLRWLFAAPPHPSDTSDPVHHPPDSQTDVEQALAALRHIEQWYERGQIDASTYQHLMNLLDEEQATTAPTQTPGPVESPPHRESPAEEAAARPSGAARPVTASPLSAAPQQHEAPRAAQPAAEGPAHPALGETPTERRTWTELLAVFMEESNIRWGELVGGMLILFCSIALVISLWSHIEAIPLLEFFVFTAVTAAMFGVGLYTEHRWRLPTTSRGVLIIATLLVPLNCLAIAAFGRQTPMPAPLIVAGQLFALGVFAPLVYLAARVIVPASALQVTGGILVASAASFITQRAADPAIGTAALNGLAAIPWFGWMLPMTVSLMQHRGRRLHRAAVRELLIGLGLLGFAAALPLALLVHQTGDTPTALRDLALLISLFSLPPLAAGLFIWRGVERPRLATLRTLGLAVATFGAMLMVAGLSLAWPDPRMLLIIAIVDMLTMLVIALRLRIVPAHGPAAAFATFAYLIAFHTLTGRLDWQPNADLASQLLSGPGGPALVGMVAVLLAAAALAARFKLPNDRNCYLLASLIVGLLAVALATVHSFGQAGDPFGATWVYLLLAIATFGAAHALERRALIWLGMMLALLAFVQGIAFMIAPPPDTSLRWPLALLTFATLALLASHIARHRNGRRRSTFVEPMRQGTLGVSVLTVLAIGAALRLDDLTPLAACTLWLSALWLAMAWLWRRPALLGAAQFGIAIALGMAVLTSLVDRPWFEQARLPLLHPWTLHALGIALGLLSLVWTALRIVLDRAPQHQEWMNRGNIRTRAQTRGQQLLESSQALLDRLLPVAMGAALLALAALAALPAIVYELSAASAATDWMGEAVNAWVRRWTDSGGWLWLAVLALVALLGCWHHDHNARLLALLPLAFAAALSLAASAMDAQMGASVLRWSLAGLFVIGCIPLHFRRRLAPLPARLGWRSSDAAPRGARPLDYTTLLLILTLPLMLLLTAVDGVLVALDIQTLGPAEGTWFDRLGTTLSLTIPLALIAITMLGRGLSERSAGWLRGGAAFAHLIALTAFVSLRPAPDAEHLGAWIVHQLLLHGAVAGGWGLFGLLLASRWTTRHLGRRTERGAHFDLPRLAAPLALFTLSFASLIALLSHATPSPLTLQAALAWPAVLIVGLFLLISLWYRAIDYAAFGMHWLGLNVIALALVHAHPTGPWLVWWLGFAPALYAVLSVGVWYWRAYGSDPLAHWIQLIEPHASPHASVRWLAPSVAALSAVTMLLTHALDMHFAAGGSALSTATQPLPRLGLASAVLLTPIALGLLADALPQRDDLRRLALLLAPFAAVAWGWAWLTPDGPIDDVLHRAVAVMVSLGALAALVSLGLMRAAGEAVQQRWRQAMRLTLPLLLAAAALALGVVLVGELFYQLDRGEVPMAAAARWIVIVTLVGCATAAIAFAVVPGRDPLGLSLRGRTAYVYGAELLVVLTLMHIRLTMPWLFADFFERIWPLVVMAIAFLGVGLGAWLRRRNLRVLAEPLETTGALLPVLPVLAFWIVGAEVHYSALLVVVGIFYGLLSVMRRSFVLGLLAVIAANGALWFLLHGVDRLAFYQHPQLWLIPPALSVLIATHLNRHQLGAAQLTAFRYACLLIIYVSSTADIFVTGVAESPWLPMVLAGLSVTGVLLGILLRVQSFLLLGALFLLMSLITMIWHASASLGWTWLWYLAGIALGIGILVLFALFEKQRQRVLHVVDDLRSWQQ